MADNHDDRISTEIGQLQTDIKRLGTVGTEGKWSVKFGKLFDDDDVQQYYEALVGKYCDRVRTVFSCAKKEVGK